MLNDNETEVTPEIKAMLAETERRAALWERLDAAIKIKYTADEIVVSNGRRSTYDARGVLNARGFRWDRDSKSWRFRLRHYYNLRMSCGRLMDGKVRTIPEPWGWWLDVAKALGIE